MDLFYGSEHRIAAVTDEYAGIDKPADLFRALNNIWSRETCAPLSRIWWSEEKRSLGQCSITAFLAQKIFGGKVYGIVLKNGIMHYYNRTDGLIFDLTSEQMKDQNIDYENDYKEQSREDFFIVSDNRKRYDLLEKSLKQWCAAERVQERG